MKPLKRIAVTPVGISGEEASMISLILDAGWHMVHIRHPYATADEVRDIIEAIPQRLHNRLRLHGHFTLASEFNLGGLHLNSRCPQPPAFYSGPVSRSCHSVDEVMQSVGCDYVTLSPVFPSISKPGYGDSCTFSSDDLMRMTRNCPTEVIALGGISPHTIPSLDGMPFHGFATLGYLMGCGDTAALKERLREIDMILKQ